MSGFWGSVVLLLVTLHVAAQPVVINEICYSNKDIIEDFRGDTPDWLELYNTSDVAVDLADYKITDDTSKNDFWSFPTYIMQPHSYLIIFASDKDTIIGTEFHTGFKISGMKETLYLLNPESVIVDAILPQCTPANLSLSRIPDGMPVFFVTHPTPKATNDHETAIPVQYIRDTLMANKNSGFYNTEIEVTLTNLHPENRIIYTLDGDDPDEEADTFTRPLIFKDRTPYENRFADEVEMEVEPGDKIFKGNILRAVVYSNGCPASNEISNVYFVNPGIQKSYAVPIVSLITDEDNLFDDETGIYTHGLYRNYDQHGEKWERPTHVEIFDSMGTLIIDQDAGFRIHGRGSRRSPQKSMRLYADAEYGSTTFEYPFFSQKPDIDKFKVLLLRTTGGTLGPLMKEELCNHLVQDLNIDYQAGETVILFINGEYWGIYNLMERENEYYVEENFNLDDVEVDIIAYDREVVVEEGSMEAYNELLAFIETADPESENFYEELAGRIDVDEMVDYFIAKLYLSDIDWPLSNLELWKIKSDTARWRFFMFDSDASMMWLDYDHLTEYNNDIEDYQRFPEFCTRILKTAMQNETFREQFRSRFYVLINTTFSTSNVIRAISHFESIYAPLVPEHIYRWHSPADYPKWQRHVTALEEFAMQRPQMITRQLESNFGNPLNIFPNPSDGSIFLDLVYPSEQIHIKIYSVKGSLQFDWNGNYTAGTPLELKTGLPPGFYILHALTGNNSYIGKLVIQ